MKYFILLILFFSTSICYSQRLLHGSVLNNKGQGVFAANIYLKSNPEKGTVTDYNGKFSLKIDKTNDTLIVSFIGYKTKKIPLKTINLEKPLIIKLKNSAQTLAGLTIAAKKPISEKSSVAKMTKLNIYFNPVSQGDPLKAITILPASTTINETADVSLRGSAADRSRVILNGVPVYKPVRSSNLNNKGFFSLFNTEIINNMYIYPGNPPLTYGNSSAGLVQIQTKQALESNQLLISTSLANIGFFLSQKVKNENSFVQVYGNYQFSAAFVNIQKKYLPNIKNFSSHDAGLNFHVKISKNLNFNSFIYFINENYTGTAQSLAYKGKVNAGNKRAFMVNNLNYYTKKGLFSINMGANTSKESFNYGNIESRILINQLYLSVNYKWFVSEDFNLQTGISYDFGRNKFNNKIPVYYYALSPTSPTYKSDKTISNLIPEAYLYTSWDINNNLSFFSGVRSKIPINNKKYYVSYQIGVKYKLSDNQSLLLNGGKYHSFTVPNYYMQSYNLISSDQIALDYSLKLNSTLLKAAAYFENGIGNQTEEQAMNSFFLINKINTFGIDLFLQQDFDKYFRFTFTYSYINQTITINNRTYKGPKNFKFLIKTTLQYNNPKLFALALSYIGRPGTSYNPITGSSFDNNTDFYKPNFSTNLFSAQYKSYNRIDLTLNKYIKLKRFHLVAFISLNNILNLKNEKGAIYNFNYSKEYFNYYQLRTIYFGIVWQLNY